MIVKDGVMINGLHPKMQIANCKVAVIYAKRGKEFRLTGCVEYRGAKSKSLHPKGRACDWGVHCFDGEADMKDVRDEIDNALGPDYDVILELKGPESHIHGEYDPSNPKVI